MPAPGATLVIVGEIASAGDLTIDGRVFGLVTARDGTLAIGPHADVEGDLRARRIVVEGRVRGGLAAAERITLAARADVEGHLSAAEVVIEDGAWFKGGVDMGRRTIAAEVARFRAAHAAS